MEQFSEDFLAYGDQLGLNVSRETFNQLITYKDLLQEWNDKVNLTAITDDEGIYQKHFKDSMSIFQSNEAKKAIKVIDVGTGAGFPGLVMKIVKPEIQLTLLDPLNKRLTFLKEVVKTLHLEGVTFIHGRGEDVSRETSHRDQYDLAVSRAVALLPTIMEFCLPFVKPHGAFIAMKGPGVDQELKLNKQLSKDLSSKLKEVIEIKDLDELEHNLIVFQKNSPTKDRFPRQFAKIKKDNQRYKDQLNPEK